MKFPGDNRLKQMQGQSPVSLKLIACIKTDNTRKLESELHLLFMEFHSHAEWFYANELILEYINKNANQMDLTAIVYNQSIERRKLQFDPL